VSTSLTGGPAGALYLLVAFYVVCLALTWRYGLRPGFTPELPPELAVADLESVS
jgi:nitrate/nitrite transporter NarK